MGKELARQMRRNPPEPEPAMWRILWHFRKQGWHFRRQVPLGPYYADFACLHAKLVSKVDGDTHGTDEAAAYDASRTDYLNSRGIHVMRFANNDVMQNADGVHTEIAAVLHAVAKTKNTPTPVPSPQGGGRPD